MENMAFLDFIRYFGVLIQNFFMMFFMFWAVGFTLYMMFYIFFWFYYLIVGLFHKIKKDDYN